MRDGDGEVNINLTAIVKREVVAALQELLSKTATLENKETKGKEVQSSGDYMTVKPATQSADYGLLPVKVVKPDGAIEHRRRKRTQQEMKAAITKAIPIVKAKHPTWSEKRVLRLAKNLVRRYKIS